MAQEIEKLTDAEKLELRELQARYSNACDKVLRAARYPFGYLRDFPYQIIPNLKANPIEVTIKVWWADKDFTYSNLPIQLRQRIEELESQLSEISKSIIGMEVSKAEQNNAPRKFEMSRYVSGGDKEPLQSR